MEHEVYFWLGTGAALITANYLIKYIFVKKEERNLDRTLKEFDEITNQNRGLEPKRPEESNFGSEIYNRMNAQIKEIKRLLSIKSRRERRIIRSYESLEKYASFLPIKIYDTKDKHSVLEACLDSS